MPNLHRISRRLKYGMGWYPRLVQLPNPLKTHEFVELTAGVLLHRGQKALDLGCGRGIQTQLVARRGVQAIGVDISPSVIARANEELAPSRVRPNVRFIAGELTSLDLSASSFDAIFSFCVLEHIADLDRVLNELHRLLRPGGVLHATVDSLSTITDPKLLETHRTLYAVHRYFTPETLRAALKRNAFDVVEMRHILTSDNARDQLAGELLGKSPIWPAKTRRRGYRVLRSAERAKRDSDSGLMILVRARRT